MNRFISSRTSLALLSLVTAVACGDDEGGKSSSKESDGGADEGGSGDGGRSGSGGKSGSGGSKVGAGGASGGKASTGGAPSAGGAGNGGNTAAGGANAAGGASAGGANAGGSAGGDTDAGAGGSAAGGAGAGGDEGDGGPSSGGAAPLEGGTGGVEGGGPCTPDATDCAGLTPRVCDQSGQWVDLPACQYACVAGACTDCAPGSRTCIANVPQQCDSAGAWAAEAACAGATPVCTGAGTCAAICTNQNICGAAGNENCCAAIEVPGGTFNRSNDVQYPATISAYKLEKFEVTVSRFREFVDAFPGSMPAAGAGANPHVASSGWDAAWDTNLPATRAELLERVQSVRSSSCFTPPVIAYRETPGPHEARPMQCLTWYEAFAFCAWTGGRLPTRAEHNFAAVGGDEQRVYPWSNPPASTTIDATYATYDSNGRPVDWIPNSDATVFIRTVGSTPAGAGRWGHMDLAGNVSEYVLDYSYTLPMPCTDCAQMTANSPATRGFVGGGYASPSYYVANDYRTSTSDRDRLKNTGVRCVQP